MRWGGGGRDEGEMERREGWGNMGRRREGWVRWGGGGRDEGEMGGWE